MAILNLVLGITELGVMIYCAYYFMSHIERNIYRAKWWYIAAFFFYGMIIILGVIFRNTILSMVAGIVYLAVMGHFLFNSNMLYIVYYALFTLIGVLGQSAILNLSSLFIPSNDINSALLMANIALTLKIILYLLLTKFMVFFVNRKKINRINKWQLVSMYMVPVWSVIFLLSLVQVGAVYIQLYGITVIAVNIVLLLVLDVYFIYLGGYISKSNELEKELQLYHQQNELQYKYYGELEKKYQDSRKVLHDMKNHLIAVEQLYHMQESDAGNTYVKDMHHMLNVLGERFYTNHKMLNIILNDKLSNAKRDGIYSVVEIGEVSLEFMKDIDVTTVFANLLDNAIEAAKRVSEHPYIRIKLNYFNEFVVISIRNSLLAEGVMNAVQKDEEHRSRHRSKVGRHMGYGLQNVKKTLEKYNGTMQTGSSESEFQVNITLPIPESR